LILTHRLFVCTYFAATKNNFILNEGQPFGELNAFQTDVTCFPKGCGYSFSHVHFCATFETEDVGIEDSISLKIDNV